MNRKSCDSAKFKCIENLNSLKVTKNCKPVVALGDSPDGRTATYLLKTRVVHNWPSQMHYRFKDGFIQLETGQVYDRYQRTIDGKKVFIFSFNEDIEILYLRYSLKEQIFCALDEFSKDDLFAVYEILDDFPDLRYIMWREGVENAILLRMETMSLAGLRDLAALLTLATRTEGPARLEAGESMADCK